MTNTSYDQNCASAQSDNRDGFSKIKKNGEKCKLPGLEIIKPFFMLNSAEH